MQKYTDIIYRDILIYEEDGKREVPFLDKGLGGNMRMLFVQRNYTVTSFKPRGKTKRILI
jgi:hypothetical protein